MPVRATVAKVPRMAARRIIELRGNVATGRIEDSSGRIWSASDIPLIRGDGCIFRITLVTSTTGSAYALSSGQSLKFGIKDPAVITGAAYLVYADNDAFNQSTDWDRISLSEGRICVRFDTDTTAMNTFLAAAGAEAKEAIAEIQITEAGEKPFTPLRFPVAVYNDVIRGDEGDPLPAQPTYPTSAEVNAMFRQIVPEGVTSEIRDGKLAFLKDGVVLDLLR